MNPPFDDPNAGGGTANEPDGARHLRLRRPELLSTESDPEQGIQGVLSERQSITHFKQRLFELTPRVLVTRAIVVANLAVFALMAFTTGEFLSPDGEILIAWGSNYGPLTLDDQWWRVFTCTFIHIGVIHVAFNMWVLWDVGHLVERLVGGVGFLVLYLISGLFGSIASVYWNPEVNSAGASGAVFGVFGALMGFMLLRGDSVPKSILGRLRSSGLTFLAINLAIGFSIRMIDNAAHIGGLVAGFVCGVLMSHPLDRTTKTSRATRNLLTAAVGALALLAAASFAPKAPVDFAGIEEEVVNTFYAAGSRWERGQLTNHAFAEIIESDVLPPWHEMRRQMEQAGGAPRGRQLYNAKRTEYVKAREEAWGALLVFLRNPTEGRRKEFERKKSVADAILKTLNSM